MKKYRIEGKWVIIFFAATLLWMLAERLSGLHDQNIEYHYIVSNFFSVVAIALYVFALLDKRKNYFGGKITWLQGFVSGLVISLGVAILTPLGQYITIALITPHFFENMIAYTVENEKMTQTAAEAYFNMKSYIIQSTIFAPLAGVLTSALVALFIRKK